MQGEGCALRGNASRLLAGLVVVLVPLAAACTVREEPADASAPVVSELDGLVERIGGRVDPEQGDPRPHEVEAAVAACMEEAGFEYHPQVPPQTPAPRSPERLTREHAELFGYGETIPLAPGVAPSRWAVLAEVPGEQENIDYRARLAPEALEAYWAALDGAAGPDGATSSGGCYGRVMAEVYADLVVPERFRAVETAVRKSWGEIEADPRVEAALETWRACMAEAGLPGLAARHDGHRLVAARADAFPAPSGMPFEEVARAFARELAELQDFEREVALADVGCLGTARFHATWDEVRAEVHALLVETHRADLEAWAAWAEEQREGRA